MKLQLIVCGVALMCLLGIALFEYLGPVAAQSSDSAADEVFDALNSWRISEGLWPLQRNATLDALALKQASYLSTLANLPDGGDIHKGQSGEWPPDRAIQPPFNWPFYGRSDRVGISEIAYAGASAQQAINYWRGSDIHRRASLNPGYREAGVASLPHEFGHLFIVVLGARPDVLPVVVDTENDKLYLTNERFANVYSGYWMHDAIHYKLLDDAGQPLTEGWQPWQATNPIPSNLSNGLVVLYSDGALEIPSEVLLDGVASAPEGAQVQAVSTPTQVLTGAETELQVVTTSTPVAVAVSAESTATQEATEAPEPTMTPTAESAVEEEEPNIEIAYDTRVIAIVNLTESELDLTGLSFVQGDTVLPISRWDTQWLTVPLSAFPGQSCLQMWSWDEGSDLAPPDTCRIVRGVVFTDPRTLFWGKDAFEVRWNNTLLKTCAGGAGRCGVSIPG